LKDVAATHIATAECHATLCTLLSENIKNGIRKSRDMRKDFAMLSGNMQTALLLSMYIRNEMENYHCKHLSDEQMKELNPIIRNAVYKFLRLLEEADGDPDDQRSKAADAIIDFQELLLPDYWELPNEQDFEAEINEVIRVHQKIN
jgi:hypothetical protein